ncbi:MAG: ATP-binding protein [Bacteroidales bacterium]|nr:ATP-binding protein [Bacteroidales bacterium]
MEQKSNVQFRAEKEYKNSREKFFLLLREIISNSIHAVLIRQSKEKDFIPDINLKICYDDTQCKIELTDNGEGFNENNSLYFEELDKVNPEKEQFKFHPLGQGRLAIVYFSDSAIYETVYKNAGSYKKRTINYPQLNDGLYHLNLFPESDIQAQDTYTKLTIILNKQNSLSRSRTFFNKYSDSEKFKNWFVENFFPFIVTNENLEIKVSYNGAPQIVVKKDSLESETKAIPIDILLNDKNYQFKLWLIKKDTAMYGDNQITCFARNLRAELSNGKLMYSIDNKEGYLLYLTSEFFDEYVDTKGEKIDISDDALLHINQKINERLDKEFKSVIESNKKITQQNLKNFKKQYPSLDPFVDEAILISGKNVIKEDEIVKRAIDEKSRIEKKFWISVDNIQVDEDTESFDDSEDCQKLLNSSLHIYVKHRETVLKRLKTLVRKFDEEGVKKTELESSIHELFLKRGVTLKESSNINHLHNLWILDDRFTTFSNNFKAQSTKTGQALSDIYIWADDPEKTKQILILELKSTTKAHNAGASDESMIAQVKRYAQKFYKNPTKELNWDVNTDKVQYIGIILARKSDVTKELTSNNVSGDYHSIPFLENSFYLNENFSIDEKDPKRKIPIRIELYSYEDIQELASSRNDVFFKLLKNEFEVTTYDENSDIN